MADQRLDVVDGEDEEERLWEALSSFKKVVHDLVEKTGLSTNTLADKYGFGKGKVTTWQNPKREAPNIPPLRFVEVLIKEAQKHADLQDVVAAAFLHQYGELLELYCAKKDSHNVHHRMLAEYQNTLLIRELNDAKSAALEQMAGLTEELETLREDRDAERRRRIALQQQIDTLRSQNQSRAVEKNAAIAQRDTIRAGLAEYENDPKSEARPPRVEQAGSHENHPHGPPTPLPPSGRGTKRRGLVLLVLALIPAGVLVVFLAVYIGTQLRGDHSGPKDTAGTNPAPNPAASADGSTGRPSNTPSAKTSATPPVTGGGPEHGGNSSSGGGTGGSSGNDTTGGSSGDASGGKTTGGSGDAGGSRGNNGSTGASGGTPATPPAPSGRFQLKDVGYGECLAVGYSVVFDPCADSPTTNWTAKAGPDGSYQLYNESAGQCLSVSYNQLSMADCGSKGGQSWRTGTSSTVVNLSSSLCLEERSGWPVMGSCEPSKSTQHWAKE
ncbi:ricin-type beta-trefoil lectin domain protein (plasmid) [Streptomyces sp. P8-A8]|uniref:RICIN domain-containing protein n=1 Tax=Streptomyces sp. P8-A8 TaxID=3029759 RepID=UPI0036DB1788